MVTYYAKTAKTVSVGRYMVTQTGLALEVADLELDALVKNGVLVTDKPVEASAVPKAPELAKPTTAK
jgi:hypothetical protein